jgi:hypothetical protein
MGTNIIVCIDEIHGMIYKDAPWLRKNTKMELKIKNTAFIFYIVWYKFIIVLEFVLLGHAYINSGPALLGRLTNTADKFLAPGVYIKD